MAIKKSCLHSCVSVYHLVMYNVVKTFEFVDEVLEYSLFK